MGIYKKNKKVIGLYKNGNPIATLIKNGHIIQLGDGKSQYDIDLDFQELNGSYGKAFMINDISITPTGKKYQANLSDLGIDKIVSFNFINTNLSYINNFPDCSSVTAFSAPSMPFAYTRLTYLDTAKLNLVNLTKVDSLYSNMQNVVRINPARQLNNITSYRAYYGGCTALRQAEFPLGNDITDISYMFYDCKALTDVGHFPSYLAVKNASHLFDGCSSLDMQSLLDNANENGMLQMFQNTNLSNISGMFKGCNFNETAFDSSALKSWPMNYVEDASYLFADTNISGAYFGYWDMWRCKNWSHMFENCTRITTLSFAGLDLASAEDFSYMFAGCYNLTSVSFESVSNLTGVTNFEGMLNETHSLRKIYVDDCSTYNFLVNGLSAAGFDTSIIENTNGDCGGSSGEFPTDRLTFMVTPGETANFAINDAGLDVSDEIFDVPLSNFGEEYSSFHSLCLSGSVDAIIAIPSSENDWGLGISNCPNLTYCDISKTDKTNLHSTFDFFENCPSLTHIDLSNWNGSISSEGETNGAFHNCPNLKTIKMLNCSEAIKSWVSQKLSERGMSDQVLIITEENNTYITASFDDPVNIFIDGQYVGQMADIPFSMQDYGGLDNRSINGMFTDGTSLKSVYSMPSLSSTTGHWDIFKGCSNLIYQDLSSWDINFMDGDQDKNSLFCDCTSLKWVNLSGWDFSNAYSESSMFTNTPNLKYVFAIGCNDTTISKIENAIASQSFLNEVQIIY